MIITKSNREISLMKEAGRVVGLVFKRLEEAIKPGMSTLDIDTIVETTMLENDCIPAEKGYYGYPASACVSVNDTLIHGIPSSKINLLGREGRMAVMEQKALDIIDGNTVFNEQEKELLEAFRSTTEKGRFKIIQAVMNICDEIEKKSASSDTSVTDQ